MADGFPVFESREEFGQERPAPGLVVAGQESLRITNNDQVVLVASEGNVQTVGLLRTSNLRGRDKIQDLLANFFFALEGINSCNSDGSKVVRGLAARMKGDLQAVQCLPVHVPLSEARSNDGNLLGLNALRE